MLPTEGSNTITAELSFIDWLYLINQRNGKLELASSGELIIDIVSSLVAQKEIIVAFKQITDARTGERVSIDYSKAAQFMSGTYTECEMLTTAIIQNMAIKMSLRRLPRINKLINNLQQKSF